MKNYIGPINAEWLDPAVELPPENGYYYARSRDGSCWPAYFSHTDDGRGLWGVPVFAWLRIGGPSDAIPREAVQAAVDRIVDEEDEPMDKEEQSYRNGVNAGLWVARRLIKIETGVTPTEVAP